MKGHELGPGREVASGRPDRVHLNAVAGHDRADTAEAVAIQPFGDAPHFPTPNVN